MEHINNITCNFGGETLNIPTTSAEDTKHILSIIGTSVCEAVREMNSEYLRIIPKNALPKTKLRFTESLGNALIKRCKIRFN